MIYSRTHTDSIRIKRIAMQRTTISETTKNEIKLTIDSDLNCGLAMQYSTEGRDHSQTI